MRLILSLAPVLAAHAAAQPLVLPASRTPLSTELPDASPVPLMAGASRLQVLHDAGELGGNTQFVVQRVGLRFDGPSAGAATQHSIANLTLRLGGTHMRTADAGSVFAANLSQPLATPLQDVRFDFTADASAVPGPEPFGGPAGELFFPLPQPVAVSVPAGGAFAFELLCSGNDNPGAIALLDAVIDPANFQQPGAATSNGRGCPLGVASPGPVLDTYGVYEPGGSISIVGHDFTPNAPVGVVVTASLFQSPLAFPNTQPICWSYVDPGTTILTLAFVASANGTVGGGEPLPIPKRPAPAGAVIYVQAVTPVAPFAGNTFGAASSNYRTIQVGAAKAPTLGAWLAVSSHGPAAAVAEAAFYGAFALHLQ